MSHPYPGKQRLRNKDKQIYACIPGFMDSCDTGIDIFLLLSPNEFCLAFSVGTRNTSELTVIVMVEQLANHLDRAVSAIGRKPLKVLVQVNTSGETSKSGIDPASCVELVKHVKEGCPNLEFSGLMTIGMPDYSSTPENFKTLSNCRLEVCKALGISELMCELSMGMSGDFELAIEMGSTNVRIGSTIFGPREYPKKQANGL